MALFKTPEWGVAPVQGEHKKLGGLDYFILWSSLGVGLLVLSAGSFLSAASFIDAILAIIVGSVAGSILLALAGKIGSDHGVTATPPLAAYRELVRSWLDLKWQLDPVAATAAGTGTR